MIEFIRELIIFLYDKSTTDFTMLKINEHLTK